MKRLVNLFLFLTPLLAFSQKLPEIDALNRVILNHKDSIIYAHVLPEEDRKNIKTSDEAWYSWYAQHDIKETRGGFDGKLLHGEYVEYYETKELKKKGVFKKGLKTGKWKSWRRDGQLSQIIYYKNGLRNGSSITYNADGTIAETAKFKKGVLIVKKEKKRKKEKMASDSTTTESSKKKNSKSKKSSKKKKGAELTEESVPSQPPVEEQKKGKTKKGKEPKIKIRRSIKVVPQPGEST